MVLSPAMRIGVVLALLFLAVPTAACPALFPREAVAAEDADWLRRLSPGLSGNEALSTFAAWGTDTDFLSRPRFDWRQVYESFPGLLHAYARKLGLGPELLLALVQGDQISLADSGWAVVRRPAPRRTLAEWLRGAPRAPAVCATLKLTYFDPSVSPEDGWPRYVIVDPRSPQVVGVTPRDVSWDSLGPEREMQTSLSRWGLLPLESLTDWRIPEHEALQREHFLLHRIAMAEVIDARGDADRLHRAREALRRVRARLPAGAYDVAEVGRFHVPPELGAAGKASALFGLLVLVRNRPGIRTFYLEAPIVGRDALRETYEREYGFEVAHTFLPASTPGIARGAHAMRASRTTFTGRLLGLLLREPLAGALSEEQRGYLSRIALLEVAR